MKGLGIEPASRRRNFGFMHILGFDREVYKKERRALIKARKETFSGKIIATDHSREALEAAQQNAKAAGVESMIEFRLCDFADTELPEGEGVIIMNPPYGERMGRKALLEETYTDIGSWFKHHAKGRRCYVFTGDLPLSKKIGLKPEETRKFYNTTIECRLLRYEIY